MVSFQVRQTLKSTARLLLLAAVAAPCGSAAQPIPPPGGASDAEQQLIEEIRDVQAQDGPHAAALIDPLAGLGLVYQERGDHARAIAMRERARQTARINHGLHSLEQVPLLRQLIRDHEAIGDAESAWALEQDLLDLVRRHPEDLRIVPALREIARKRLDVLARYETGEFPPQIVLGCYYDPPPHHGAAKDCHAGSRGDVVESIRSEAWRYYRDAIDVLVGHGLYQSDDLRELEMELLRSSYRHDNYALGKGSYRRLTAYNLASSEPWLDRVTTLVEMADWDFLFARGRSARESVLDTYQRAYELLRDRGISQASIDRIFSPETPVVLPSFLPNPLAPGDPPRSDDYIDIAFDVTRDGAAERIEIRAISPSATDDAGDRLARLISDSTFRPRMTDGELRDASRVLLRYYLPHDAAIRAGR